MHLKKINSILRGITFNDDVDIMDGLASPSSADMNGSDECTDVKSSDSRGFRNPTGGGSFLSVELA
jgi:hypothetical protein